MLRALAEAVADRAGDLVEAVETEVEELETEEMVAVPTEEAQAKTADQEDQEMADLAADTPGIQDKPAQATAMLVAMASAAAQATATVAA